MHRVHLQEEEVASSSDERQLNVVERLLFLTSRMLKLDGKGQEMRRRCFDRRRVPHSFAFGTGRGASRGVV